MTEKETSRSSKKIALNLLLAAVSAFVLYQVYAISFPSDHNGNRSREAGTTASPAKNIVQIDVLNGCGVSGTGQKVTSFLRASGYDVVDMGNYKTFDVKQSMVVDRCGNADIAKKIASDLGIDPANVIQQISPEYFVTASVVLGKDFKTLRAWK
ncbi:MAG TPA: LytR C-terminal domain-containing protein [Bacteroidota bacterium]|nr:LytR C-terminal domain-containing protein [Bacteroidota bacterium]